MVKPENICCIKGCDRPILRVKLKLCRGHVEQLYRNGTVKKKPLRVYRKFDSIK